MKNSISGTQSRAAMCVAQVEDKYEDMGYEDRHKTCRAILFPAGRILILIAILYCNLEILLFMAAIWK